MQKYVAFLKVIEMGSFTKAAELLGYTQPALSQMIAALEKELIVSQAVAPFPVWHPANAGG